MKITSYNARGLRLGDTSIDKVKRLVVDSLLEDCDILCVQETFHAQQDLGKLNSLNPSFHGAGESTTDLSRRLCRGRIKGGVAILWRRQLDSVVNVLRMNADWCIALHVKCNNREFIIVNVYMPYDKHDVAQEEEYLTKLAFIGSFIEEHPTTNIFITGDMNADISGGGSRFGKHMTRFCEDNNLVLSSQLLLPADSFTYYSEAHHSTSFLDHVISSADAHASIRGMKILHDEATTDHIPLQMVLDTDILPELASEGSGDCNVRIDWAKLQWEDRLRYTGRTDTLLGEIQMPLEAIRCSNANCKDAAHCSDLCTMYDSIVSALHKASEPIQTRSRKAHIVKPGWKEFVSEHQAEAKLAHKAWILAGRPRQGPELEQKKVTNARYKYAVRFVGRHEQALRANSMAEKLLDNNPTDFWKEVKKMNRANTALPCNIEGTSGAGNIAELWRQHYSGLFNCIQSDPYCVGSIEGEAVTFSIREVLDAIGKLADGKACGQDKITAEHLKLASPRLAAKLALCFTGLMTHGILPDSMLTVTLVPVIKDKAGKVGSMDNYRPIAIASILSKVMEGILLDRLSEYIYTTDNQFGFKAKHSTDLCIYALKEAVETYRRKNSSMLIGFIDASKAFDRVNHHKLFTKLKQRGVPNCIIRILAYWYAEQSMQVRWGNALSTPFTVGNGVRQGGLLSPAFFNLYMDDLSVQLNKCRTGCMIGNTLVNHFMYADDLAIISPSSAGFQLLLNICTEYGVQNDVKYNAKKSVVMICRTKKEQALSFPTLYLSGQALSVCDKTKYLGHIITEQMDDDDDMYRQRRALYAQANMLIRKFHFCTDEVKISLFRAYCTPIYTAPLWVSYKKESYRKLWVAYNDCLRILLNKPRTYTSVSKLFCDSRLCSFEALLRNLMYKFMCRMEGSQNDVIMLLSNPRRSSVRHHSHMWKHWNKCLHRQ